ncbi:MAG: hypothetical protein E4H17_01530, partial [Gemmatimonadales bacterium]
MKPRIRSAIVTELVETGTLRSFRVIDTHGHMGEWSAIYFPNPDPESMLRTMDRCGVEWLAFSHHDALQALADGNEKARAAIAAHPDRLLGYWAVNPNYPDRLQKEVAEFGRWR